MCEKKPGLGGFRAPALGPQVFGSWSQCKYWQLHFSLQPLPRAVLDGHLCISVVSSCALGSCLWTARSSCAVWDKAVWQIFAASHCCSRFGVKCLLRRWDVFLEAFHLASVVVNCTRSYTVSFLGGATRGRISAWGLAESLLITCAIGGFCWLVDWYWFAVS